MVWVKVAKVKFEAAIIVYKDMLTHTHAQPQLVFGEYQVLIKLYFPLLDNLFVVNTGTYLV